MSGTKSHSGGARPGAGPKRKTVKLSLADLAETIYMLTDGADHKPHHAETVQEIYEWLYNGTPERPNIKTLAAEWIEYQAQS